MEMYRGNAAAHLESLAIETRLDFLSIRQNRHGRKLVFARSILCAIKKILVPSSSARSADADSCHWDALFSASIPSLSVSRHVFTYLRSFRYRASAFAVYLILRPSSSSPSSPPPPPPPPPSSSSTSVSSSSTSSFSTFHQRRRLVVLLSSFLFLFLPTLLPLIPHDQTTTTATNNHLVPLRCRERRCRCARRLIFGRTFRFGVLYWTVQKWHLPVSELTSCQVSVSFARAVPGRWRVYAFACTYIRSRACCVCVYTCMRVAPQTRLFPHSIRGSIWPSLSRACSRSPPYECDSGALPRRMCV